MSPPLPDFQYINQLLSALNINNTHHYRDTSIMDTLIYLPILEASKNGGTDHDGKKNNQ